MSGAAMVLLLTLLAASCAPLWILHRPPRRCADGLPPKVFHDPACPPDGVCGFTCAPLRWDVLMKEGRYGE